MKKLNHKVAWTFAFPVLLLLKAQLLLAQEEGGVPIFEPPQDVVLLWARRGALVIMLISFTLVLGMLLFRRNHLMENFSKWMLFLGLCILPLPVALLSAGIGMEDSKAVEFCHSCHEPMDPFVNDMMNPESETLAAVHYSKRYIQHENCWTCHSDYGIAGTADAKMTGMIHMYKYTTNTWEAPIKLYHPYRWQICLECHANSSLFKAPRNDETAHEGVMEGVMSGDVACTDCHETAHPAEEERSEKP